MPGLAQPARRAPRTRHLLPALAALVTLAPFAAEAADDTTDPPTHDTMQPPTYEAELICVSSGPDYGSWLFKNRSNQAVTTWGNLGEITLLPDEAGVVHDEQSTTVIVPVTWEDGAVADVPSTGENDCTYTPPTSTAETTPPGPRAGRTAAPTTTRPSTTPRRTATPTATTHAATTTRPTTTRPTTTTTTTTTAPPPMVAVLAAAAPAPVCATSWPVGLGDVGYPARCVETRLRQLGYSRHYPDDFFDSASVAALRAFQAAAGISPIGWADYVTLVRLRLWQTTGFPSPSCRTNVTVSSGSTGPDALCVERRLAQLGYAVGGPDNVFDSTAYGALRSFQYRNGLWADGIAGFRTLSRLGIYGQPPAPDPSTATCSTSWPVFLNDVGYPARCVETRLRQLGYAVDGPDDKFDSTSVSSLRAFQERVGLEAIGWADYQTLVKLGLWAYTGFPIANCKVRPSVSEGSSGDGALCAEHRLVQLGFLAATPDSYFDSGARAALRSFQYRNGLYADGVAGAHTLSRLGIYDPSPPPAGELPADSGSGRRIVYSRAQQRFWAVDSAGNVVKTHRVSGRRYEPYGGTYYVYSRSEHTYSTGDPNVRWRWMVRFAYGPNGGRIGFHEIPNRFGVPLQTTEQLGLPLSAGCVRQSTSDALWVWNWAPVGTKVVVL